MACLWLPDNPLFHYTSAATAATIRCDALDDAAFFVVGVGAHYGHGLYATDLDPFDTPMDEVNLECFHGAQPAEELTGVLVLDAAEGPFRHVIGHIWLLASPPVAAIDLAGLLVGVGIHDDEHGWRLAAL